MPRVLRIINRFNLGGPSYNAAYLTRFLGEAEGDEVVFETRLIGGSPIAGEEHSGFIMDSLGIPYEEIPEMSRSINPLNDFRAFLKIRKIIREFRPDIVHTHAAKAGALGRMAAWMENVPVIVHTYHGHVFSQYFGGIKSALVKGIERWLSRRSTAIVNISEKLWKEIVEEHKICSPDKAVVIPLGFDLKRFEVNQVNLRKDFRLKYSLEENQIAIGIIGRFAPVKNHKLFFDALAKLKERNIPCVAFIIGDGESKNELMQYARQLGIYENPTAKVKVVFTSWIHRIEDALAGLDIIALSSLNEGTPVSLIEAQAAARAVVTTDVGGVRDCLLSDRSGFVVSNDINAFADAMEKLIVNSELRQSFGHEGRAFVNSKFSYSRLVSDMRKLYVRLLSEKKK